MVRKQNPESMNNSCRCLKGLVHPTRLVILAMLRGGDRSVSDLVAGINGVSQSNISQHLAQMKGCGILTSRREGNQIFYAVTNKRLYELLDLMKELFIR